MSHTIPTDWETEGERHCCWPSCEARYSEKVSVPLCDRHAIRAYREVGKAMKIAEHQDRNIKHLAEGYGVARTMPSEGRTRRCDALCDEVAKWAVDPHEAAAPIYPTQQ